MSAFDSLAEVPTVRTITTFVLAASAALAQGPTLDEFSTASLEFVEIGNGTEQPQDIGGFVLELRSASLQLISIPIQMGVVLQPGDSWVLGEAGVPNIDQPVAGSLLDDQTGAITLVDLLGQPVDTVGYGNAAGVLAPFVEHAPLVGQQLIAALPHSWQRLVSGWDTDNNAVDFRLLPPSPGVENAMPLLTPYAQDASGLAVGQPIPGWSGTRKQPAIMDPSQPGPQNPQILPPSPNGGLAMQFGDVNGNSNHAMLGCSPMGYLLLEAWVWIDLDQPGTTWSIGVHGHSDGAYLPPDPLNPLAQPNNGDTGLCWTMVCTGVGQGEMFLIDNGTGGAAHTVLGSVPLSQGINDGWQRLRMECVDEFAECYFGGDYGQLNGQMFAGELMTDIGGVWCSSVSPLPGAGLVLDELTLDYPDGFVTWAEFGAPTTFGQPQVTVNHFPRVGDATFGLRAFDHQPNNLGMFVVGFDELVLPLTAIGATSGTFLWNSGDVLTAFFSDPLGQGFLPLPLLPQPMLAGLDLHIQSIDFDAALPDALPLGHSRSLGLTLWGGTSRKITPTWQASTICIYSFIKVRGGKGACPFGLSGTLCVNCSGTCPGPNLKVLVHNNKGVHSCTLKLFRQHGPSCEPSSSCPANAWKGWRF